MADKGCGGNAWWSGGRMLKCGETHAGNTVYCEKCELKQLGVTVGVKFYEICYYPHMRAVYSYEILKLNEKSVRMRCVFLDGRQKPQEFSIDNSKTLKRFEGYSKTFREAAEKNISVHKQSVKDLIEEEKGIPQRLEAYKQEIEDLKTLDYPEVNHG